MFKRWLLNVPYRPIPIPVSIPIPTRRSRLNYSTLPTTSTKKNLELAPNPASLPTEKLAANSLGTQVISNLQRYPEAILFTRIGTSYHIFFDSAQKISEILKLPLSFHKFGSQGYYVVRISVNKLNDCLRTLVLQNNINVAIAEEFRSPSPSGKSVRIDRRVVRLITPASFFTQTGWDSSDNSYVMAIAPSPSPSPNQQQRRQEEQEHEQEQEQEQENEQGQTPVGIAWINISTGDIYTLESTFQNLSDEIYRIDPSQIVLDQTLKDEYDIHNKHGQFWSYLKLKDPSFVTSFVSPSSLSNQQLNNLPLPDVAVQLLRVHTESIQSSPISSIDQEESNAENNEQQGRDQEESDGEEDSDQDGDLNLVNSTTSFQQNEMTTVHQLSSQDIMHIDAHTLRSLEIHSRATANESFAPASGHLLDTINFTTSAGGKRLLQSRLCFPSTNLEEIHNRQSIIACLLQYQQELWKSMKEHFSAVKDPRKILQAIVSGRASPSSLLDLCDFIRSLSELREKALMVLNAQNVKPQLDQKDKDVLTRLLSDISDQPQLAQDLERFIPKSVRRAKTFEQVLENMNLSNKEIIKSYMRKDKWLINPDASQQLEILHSKLDNCYKLADRLQHHLNQKFNVNGIQLKYHRGRLPVLHLRSLKNIERFESDSQMYLVRSTSRTRQYMYPEWTELANTIVDIRRNIRQQERTCYQDLADKISTNYVDLCRNCEISDELDVGLSLATVALENSYCRPTLDHSTNLSIINGRHPSIEKRLAEQTNHDFVPNSLEMVKDESSVHVITGPNMGGKSTFLRMVAQIALLAQAGSFVPADKAQIGIIDQIFIRTGSKDSLFKGRSSFMVEMLETADILNRFTESSLLLMDEIGRGSAGDDGTSIAYATIETVAAKHARALFATHFHNLIPLLGYNSRSNGIVPASKPRQGVAFSATDLVQSSEDPNKSDYTYKIRSGVTWESDGIKVAKMANMPAEVINVAQTVLDDISNFSKLEHEALEKST